MENSKNKDVCYTSNQMIFSVPYAGSSKLRKGLCYLAYFHQGAGFINGPINMTDNHDTFRRMRFS